VKEMSRWGKGGMGKRRKRERRRMSLPIIGGDGSNVGEGHRGNTIGGANLQAREMDREKRQ